MSIGAVITAAGMSSRMGEFKPMMNIGSISISQRVIASLRQAGVEIIVVVTGFRAEDLERHLAQAGVLFLRNESYETTHMFDSAAIGLQYLKDKCDPILFTPVDIPLFTADTVTALLKSDADVALPVCQGELGHPIKVTSRAAEILSRDSGEDGLRGAISRCGLTTEYVEVNDRGALHDADTPEDYKALLAYHNRRILRPVVDIKLTAQKPFFDARIAMLLFLVEDTNSVRLACHQMQMSYSTGWKLINASEAELGFPLVHRCQGGANGSRTTLTPEGQDLLGRYRDFSSKLRLTADDLFEECFHDIFS